MSSQENAHRKGWTSACDLILHFGYHKCLTMFYSRLIQSLSVEFNFSFMPVYDEMEEFHKAALHSVGARVVLCTDRDEINWGLLPSYRASHFIRDPRDMVVSGYYYHLWTDETWCRSKSFEWSRYTSSPTFGWVEPERRKWPSDISYHDFLNSLDVERGLIMEMIFRESSFQQMRRWRFDNPLILELRYEEIAGNEERACSLLCEHYGFSAQLGSRALELARFLALKNQAKKSGTHIRSGKSGQWAQHFTERNKECFHQLTDDLLVYLGYEQTSNW